jgi:hypothetical protein
VGRPLRLPQRFVAEIPYMKTFTLLALRDLQTLDH